MELLFEIISKVFDGNNSIYFWVIIAIIVLFISEIKLNSDYLKEKVLFSYLILIILRFLGLIPIKFILPFSFIIYFVFIEFIYNKGRSKLIINNPFYYLIDFFYVMIFRYHIIGFILSLLIISNYFYNSIIDYFPLLDCIYTYYVLGSFSLIIYLFTISRVYINKFNTLCFDEIIDKMEHIVSFKNYKHDKRLEPFTEILSWYEDRSFLNRKNSFNLLNWSFVSYKFNRVKSNRKSWVYNIIFIGGILKDFVTLIIIGYKIIKSIVLKIINTIKLFIKIIKKKRKLYSIRTIIRGYSTIEMQLLRTLALKDGYECTIQRKFYELIYTDVFFKSLKNTYRYYVYSNLDEYKYYLLELYIRVAPTFINGKRYDNINLLFKDRDNIFELTNEEFFLFTLGLSNKLISFERIDYYYCPIELDRMRHVKALEEVLNYQISIVPDTEGIPIKIMLFDNIRVKRYPITLYFNYSKKLIDVIKYIKDFYCDRGLEAIPSNIKYYLYSNVLNKESLELINIPIFDYNGEFTDLLNLSIVDLETLCDIHNKYLEVIYNCEFGLGGAVGYENGIKYYFNNNEKSIHVNFPHINCKYAEENIRINLMTLEIMDNKKFKSPVKTKKALNYVKDNQEKLLDIWENVVDKDNVLNKKVRKKLEFV